MKKGEKVNKVDIKKSASQAQIKYNIYIYIYRHQIGGRYHSQDRGIPPDNYHAHNQSIQHINPYQPEYGTGPGSYSQMDNYSNYYVNPGNQQYPYNAGYNQPGNQKYQYAKYAYHNEYSPKHHEEMHERARLIELEAKMREERVYIYIYIYIVIANERGINVTTEEDTKGTKCGWETVLIFCVSIL